MKGLEPFRELTIDAFAGFLRRAEEYERTGILPVSTKAAPKPRAKKETGPPYSVDDAIREIQSLYEQAADESTTYAKIQEEVKKLDKLKKPELDRLTTEFGLGKLKSKAAAIKAVADKIEGYKKSVQRTQF